MKTLSMGFGMVAGAALALTLVTSIYPDVPKRMARDGRRFVRSTRRTICDVGQMLSK